MLSFWTEHVTFRGSVGQIRRHFERQKRCAEHAGRVPILHTAVQADWGSLSASFPSKGIEGRGWFRQ
jgi:hypothetical protein